MKYEAWRFHFYKVTGVIPRGDTIAEAWARLPTPAVWSALRYFTPPEIVDWFELRGFQAKRPPRNKGLWMWSCPLIAADTLRAMMPVPDAEDLRQGAEFGEGEPWDLTPLVRHELARANKKRRKAELDQTIRELRDEFKRGPRKHGKFKKRRHGRGKRARW